MRLHPELALAAVLSGAAPAPAQDAAHTDVAAALLDDRAQVVRVVPVRAVGAPAPHTRAVDLAICLDTSGSMSGLIEAAKQKLWAIVNDLALAEPEPMLRVALLTYGNDGHSAENGWVRLDVPLTADLDQISRQLFALGTNGGTELVGRVVDQATRGLGWSADPLALKLIVVAGNESADQDQVVSFRDACKAAISRGVMINSIYCGNPGDAIAAGWSEVAKLADGHFATIDHERGTVVVETPFDDQLNAFSAAANATFLPLGDLGREGWANQVAQDRNAEGLNRAAGASRAATKGGKLYKKSWDLCEMAQEEDFDWTKLEDEDLPEEMRPLDLEGRKAYVAERLEERARINAQIAELSSRRSAWVEAYMRLNGLDASQAFDHALRGALRVQAESKGFRFREQQALQLPTPEQVQADLERMRAEQGAAQGSGAPQQGAGAGQQVRGGGQVQQQGRGSGGGR